ncbi:MAG: 50S ribosomal protein L23 [Legionellales bacterium]|nr:50S ribosomal protein L23 [Legionellales bacterium]|tara:strand:- start:150 stop:443 length:294 start_codon:yes stop_codon:yes gene_type:complete
MKHSQPESTLQRRVLTEKSARCEGNGTYVFKVLLEADKNDVSDAVELIYGKKPKKVNLLVVKGKRKAARGKRPAGKVSNWKKAYVTMSEGDVLSLDS